VAHPLLTGGFLLTILLGYFKIMSMTSAASTKTTRKVRTRKAKATTTQVKPLPKVEELRPMTPIITRQEYIRDIKIRWNIHTYEVGKLGEDIKKAYDSLLPIFKNYRDYVVTAYQREFGSPVK